MHAKEPFREDAAVEVGADLALDEPRHRRAGLPRRIQEGLDLFADDLVEERLLGLVAFVLGHAVPNRDQPGGGGRRGYAGCSRASAGGASGCDPL